MSDQDQAIEPSSLEQSTSSEKSSKSADFDKSFEDHVENNEDSEGGLFIPIKKRKKEKPKEQLEAAILEASELVKEVVNNDPTKELINFLREEMDRSREHECKMIQLLTQPHLGSNSFHCGSAQYTLSGPVPTDYRAFLPNASNRPGWPEGSFRSLTPTCSMSSASNENFQFSDGNVFQNL